MFVKILGNPDTGKESNKEEKWWTKFLTEKKEIHDKNTDNINELVKQNREITDKENNLRAELIALCERYDTLVKQIAAEERSKNKDHRRLELDES